MKYSSVGPRKKSDDSDKSELKMSIQSSEQSQGEKDTVFIERQRRDTQRKQSLVEKAMIRLNSTH